MLQLSCCFRKALRHLVIVDIILLPKSICLTMHLQESSCVSWHLYFSLIRIPSPYADLPIALDVLYHPYKRALANAELISQLRMQN